MTRVSSVSVHPRRSYHRRASQFSSSVHSLAVPHPSAARRSSAKSCSAEPTPVPWCSGRTYSVRRKSPPTETDPTGCSPAPPGGSRSPDRPASRASARGCRRSGTDSDLAGRRARTRPRRPRAGSRAAPPGRRLSRAGSSVPGRRVVRPSPPDHSRNYPDLLELLRLARERVTVEHDQVGEVAG
jgi:hypothetical protein